MKFLRTNILNPISEVQVELLKDYVIIIDDNKVIEIKPFSNSGISADKLTDYTDFVVTPGFIDTHVHLSQWNIRGKYKSDLLEWLNTYTFIEERKSFEKEYATKVAEDFFDNLILNGTTTSSIYVSTSKQATDIAFKTAQKKKCRALIGKVNMDFNCPDFLIENSEQSFRDSVELCEKWDNVDNLNFVFTPRFAPVCTELLMRKIGDYATKHDKYVQTHLSENINEIEMVRALYPKYKSYTDIYYQNNLLSNKTIMGHCIHLNDSEIDLMKKTGTKIAHCPDSNFFLKSGQFPYNKLKESGLTIGLASDVAGGTDLNMLYHMKMANYRQSESIEVNELFYLATLGSAKVLSQEDKIGSIEVGKEADLVFFEINDIADKTSEEILSELIFINRPNRINSVFIGGTKVYSK